MSIKNLDGSTYKLSSPNPIVKNQNGKWDKYEIHNMDYEFINIPLLEEEEEEIKEEIIVEEPKPEIKEQLKKETKPKPKKLKNSVDFWCVPAKIRGKGRNVTIEYFDKVMFEGIILKDNGFNLIFWANAQIIEKGAIIYPFRNAENEYLMSYSWWKVENIIDETEDERLLKSGGKIFVCVPSEYTPHFAD